VSSACAVRIDCAFHSLTTPFKGTDTVSGRAYEAAMFMSRKLDIAISKMVLTVADRLERERIDHANAEREIEANGRAEEDIIRAAWKKEPGKDGTSPTPPSQIDIAQKIRLVRRAAQRRDATDFEMPFFDEEDNGQHESSHFEVVKLQKSLYERQTQELTKMRLTTNKIGASVFANLLQRHMALQWVGNEAKKRKLSDQAGSSDDLRKTAVDRQEEENVAALGYEALSELGKEGRQLLQIKLVPPQAKTKKSRKRPLLDF
jgi:hypothetical protein